MRVSHVCPLATSPARLEARMDSLLSLPGIGDPDVVETKPMEESSSALNDLLPSRLTMTGWVSHELSPVR
jgi:hypothetical protein